METDRLQMLLATPEVHLHPAMRRPGYTLPNAERLIAYRLDEPAAHERVAAVHGITVVPGRGQQNLLAVDRDLRAPSCRVSFTGTGSTVVLGENAAVEGVLTLQDEAVIVVAGFERTRPLRLRVTLRDCGERVFWGRGSSTGGTASSVKGDGASWLVGDDCMFSWGTYLRPFDMHTIVDLAAGTVINPPRDIVIGPHVWVGQNALILSGVEIGAGTIVGANSVVPGNRLAPMSIYAGQPARVIRSGTTWDRESKQTPASVERARQIAAHYGYWSSALDTGGRHGQRPEAARLRHVLARVRSTAFRRWR